MRAWVILLVVALAAPAHADTAVFDREVRVGYEKLCYYKNGRKQYVIRLRLDQACPATIERD